VFNTNGTLLDAERRRRLLDEGPDELRVSLDAATAASFEKVRAAPARVFEKIVEGVRALARETKAAGRGPALSLWIIGVRENESDLVPLVRLAHELGVPEVYLHRLVFQEDSTAFGIARRDESLFAAPDERVDAVVGEAARVAAELGVRFQGSGAAAPTEVFEKRAHLAPRPWSACRRPWTLVYVTANGHVLPCCIAPFATTHYPGIVLGNVFTEPLSDIWNGERYRAFRKALLSASPHECCSGCGVKWSL
jgi:MoaA/NifB/PqqE/SkfB family radical SAM enzyme